MPAKMPFGLKGKDRDSYLESVLAFPLASIKSDDHLEGAQKVMDRLLAKGELDDGEEMYLDALSDLVAAYEDHHYAIEPASDAAMLHHLLEAKGITQAQLSRDTLIPKSTISEILAGKKPFSRQMMRKLAGYFKMDVSVLAANIGGISTHTSMKPRKSKCGQGRRCAPDQAGAPTRIQPFPTDGPLFDNLDLSKPELQTLVGGLSGQVRSHKMISIKQDGMGGFQQEGSAPNFQGGLLTQCTCIHVIRAEKRNPVKWIDTWLAGFTGLDSFDRPWLFYLARIERVYLSQAELWSALDSDTRRAKSARLNQLGDVYEPNPISSCLNPLDAKHYYPPIQGHSHEGDDGWKRDIEFLHRRWNRHAVFLVAKPTLTFLWRAPCLYLEGHPRNDTWETVHSLIHSLRVAEF